MKSWVKVLASLALLFHLFAVFVFPNPEALLARQTSWLFFPYGNLLGLNTTWRFFSPNPAVKWLAYEAYAYDENGEVSFEKSGRFPESLEKSGSREGFNRTMNFTMLTGTRSEGAEKFLKPYFCKSIPQAQEISFYFIDYELPSLERAKIEAGDFESMALERKTPLGTVNCSGGDE